MHMGSFHVAWARTDFRLLYTLCSFMLMLSVFTSEIPGVTNWVILVTWSKQEGLSGNTVLTAKYHTHGFIKVKATFFTLTDKRGGIRIQQKQNSSTQKCFGVWGFWFCFGLVWFWFFGGFCVCFVFFKTGSHCVVLLSW